MTDEYRPLLPPHLYGVEPPRPGTWLDKNARKMADLLAERHNLGGFDPEATRLALAAELQSRVEAIRGQLGISEASARRYFDDETFESIVDGVAVSLADEKPGGQPFLDEDLVRIPVVSWLRAVWSLQLVAQAVKAFNADYAWSLIQVATGMMMVASSRAGDGSGGAFDAPRAGASYAARVLGGAAEQVLAWSAGVDDLTPEQLSDGSARDARALTYCLNRRA